MINQQKNKINLPLPAFSIIILFVVLMILGAVLIPLLSVQLEPSEKANSILINYNWHDASAEMIEHGVTAKLEGIIAGMKGVKSIKSSSSNGRGNIHLILDKQANVNQTRYEISTIIRMVYPNLPKGVSYPLVYANRPGSGIENKSILSYTINGNVNSSTIQQYVEKNIKPKLALIEGTYQVNVYGASSYAWELRYNTKELNLYNVTPEDISIGIRNYFKQYELGRAFILNPSQPGAPEFTFLTLKTDKPDSLDWNKIPIEQLNGRTIYLTDLVKVCYAEQEPQAYYRLNGLNTVNLEVVADKNTNYILLAEQIKKQVGRLKQQLPSGYSIVQIYDATDFLKKELDKITWRTLATLLVLLLFVYAVSRQVRYLLLILLSLISNLLLAFILYYVFDLEIHLYSLAGITVSMGMIIDNSIVVIDHVRHKNNMRVFLAVVGATLTTIGAVCIIFFLDEQQRLKLVDFAWVLIINLGISLLVAYWFIPALMEKLPLPKRRFSGLTKRKRNIVRWSQHYDMLIGKFIRFRAYLIAFIILLFGLPVFMIPAKIEKDNWFASMYNQTAQGEFHREHLKPLAEKALGGTLRLFFSKEGQFYYQEGPQEQTQLVVSIKMPKGATLAQMNRVVISFENYLSRFQELDLYKSRVYSGQQANISILFKKKHQEDFPYILKSRLETKAVFTGLAEFQIQGVGQGFSNSLNMASANHGIILMGYNYERLRQLSDQVKKILTQNPRVEKVAIGSHRDRLDGNYNYEFVIEVHKPERLLVNKFSSSMINASIHEFSNVQRQVTGLMDNGSLVPVILTPMGASASVWEVLNEPARTNSSSFVRLKEFASMTKEKINDEIYRENQQYQLVVNYNFIGDPILGSRFAEGVVKEVNADLPLGYSVKEDQFNFWRGSEKNLTWAIFLTLGIVFIICATLLNSFWQPLAVITMAPISFIGVFLVTYIFEFRFDEGGYAAFIILCGVVVNAALFILNDFNNLKNDYPKRSNRVLYIKAFNSKIIPVLLSTISMVLGLLPFVVYASKEPFWYALAMSSIGGLFFSMVAILVFLPIFLKNMENKF